MKRKLIGKAALGTILGAALVLAVSTPARAQFIKAAAATSTFVNGITAAAASLFGSGSAQSGYMVTVRNSGAGNGGVYVDVPVNECGVKLPTNNTKICVGGAGVTLYDDATGALAIGGNGVIIGGGTKISKSNANTSAAVDFASTGAGACNEQNVTVTGAVTGATCSIGPPAAFTAGWSLTCFVSAADTVKLRGCNHTGGVSDPASQTFSVRTWNN